MALQGRMSPMGLTTNLFISHAETYHMDTQVVSIDERGKKTRSTWGKENDTLKLDIDPKSHFAWTGGSQKVLDKGRVSKYNKKFSNLMAKK